MQKDKSFHPVQFIGIILSIVFEFLGFLLLFAFIGYYVMITFYKDNYIVLLIFIFIGFFAGIYYMYKRAKSLSEYKLLKENNLTFSYHKQENENLEKIRKVRKELDEYDKIMKKRFMKTDINKRKKDEEK